MWQSATTISTLALPHSCNCNAIKIDANVHLMNNDESALFGKFSFQFQ